MALHKRLSCDSLHVEKMLEGLVRTPSSSPPFQTSYLGFSIHFISMAFPCFRCLASICISQPMTRLDCGHMFHFECMLAYFNKVGVIDCPVCEFFHPRHWPLPGPQENNALNDMVDAESSSSDSDSDDSEWDSDISSESDGDAAEVYSDSMEWESDSDEEKGDASSGNNSNKQ